MRLSFSKLPIRHSFKQIAFPRAIKLFLFSAPILVGFFTLGVLGTSSVLLSQENERTNGSQVTDQPPSASDDWAKDYLQDPLASIVTPTMEDLMRSLSDPELQFTVIERHFVRATSLSDDEKLLLLTNALSSKHLVIRQQAAVQLLNLGFLERHIRNRLEAIGKLQDSWARDAVILGFAYAKADDLPKDDTFIQQLIDGLKSTDREIHDVSAQGLVRLAGYAVPKLLDALDDPEVAVQAAKLLGIITFSERAENTDVFKTPMRTSQALAADLLRGDERSNAISQAPAKGIISSPVRLPSKEAFQLREIAAAAAAAPDVVRVYYGTNREILESKPAVSSTSVILHVASVALGLLGIVWLSILLHRYFTEHNSNTVRKFPGRLLLLVTGWGILCWSWSIPRLNDAVRLSASLRQGVVFGPHRFSGGVKHYGYCDISIPDNHSVGQVESPTWGREDEHEHVVLQRAELLEKEAFFSEIRRILQSISDPSGCFVFVHGYNVSFDDAAKRTAQIYYDMQFRGVPIFYSWPSRASLRHYFSDRNEVQFSRELIKEFLIDVAEKSGAENIHVIAHSMGADAVAGAIASIDSSKVRFDQIILAAPDIDADVFKQIVAPKLKERSARTTLYCSKNDWALHASYHFNDSWRAGDSSRGLLIGSEFDTIDASSIDTELLGHSYYGNCIDILQDIAQLFERNPTPQERNLVDLRVQDGSAWTFPRLLPPSINGNE